jgi:hypothetical protein
MDISSATLVQSLPVDMASGRSTRIPDLRLLLTVHAARQSTTPTARAVHESNLPVAPVDEPSRLSLIFTSERVNPVSYQKVTGSFNTSVAALMAVGSNGEGLVHSGG